MGSSLSDSHGRVGGCVVRGGTGDDAADGYLLPSHHHLCATGEPADFAFARSAYARGAAHAAVAGGGAGCGFVSGHGGCAGTALWGLAGSLLWSDGAGRFSDFQSSALAVGCILRAVGNGNRAGDSERCWRRAMAAA